MRGDLAAIVRAAIDGVAADQAVRRALAEPSSEQLFDRPLHVLAVGKAAAPMAAAVAAHPGIEIRTLVGIGTHVPETIAPNAEWYTTAHPIPDARSVAAASRALQVASSVGPDECLLLLLSGGASAAMAAPAHGISLEDKQHAVRTMMLAGADIYALNTVRKHLSQVKGGRLAAACAGVTVTLAISDVVGDDLSVIGSGPAVADTSTWHDAATYLERFGGETHRLSVKALAEQGRSGALPDTPKPDDPTFARTTARVIASGHHALASARRAAEALGYDTIVVDEPITGEARETAAIWFGRAMQRASAASGPICVLSAGETTVRVVGRGRGGRNQEFALALVEAAAAASTEIVVASVGTDGIDGPTDAAGAIVDSTSEARANDAGLAPAQHLADNDAYAFFDRLGDLMRTGPTGTNVGDVQVMLVGSPRR